jgi:protein-L-isoaspartate O-methyltransferase
MPSFRELPVAVENGLLRIGTHDVMHTQETPLMEVFAREVAGHGGDVLEMGFGLGISANLINQIGCKSHTIIEAHPAIAEMARAWAVTQSVSTLIVEGYWQDVLPSLGIYDTIFFEGGNYNPPDGFWNFIKVAFDHLRSGGMMTGFNDVPGEMFLRYLLGTFAEVRFVKAECEACVTVPDAKLFIPILRKA